MEHAPAHLVIAPILIPMVIGALLLFFDDRERLLKLALSLLSSVLVLAASITLLARVQSQEGALAAVYLLGNWPAPIAINLVADRLSLIMLLLAGSLVPPALLFASERWERTGPHFHSLFQFLVMGLNGAFLTGDLFNLFVFFEIMLAASYGLALHGGGPARIRAGMHYIAINLGASLVFLIGIAMVFSAVGSLNLAEISVRAENLQGFSQPALHVGLAMLGLAFLVKAGMWPLGFWLVPAYSSAAGPVAAVFAVLSKVGIYSLLRLALMLPGEGVAFGSVIIFIGGFVTLTFACLGMLASQSMKRASAYFVLMSSGTLLAAFGISHPATTAGALFYLVSSTLAVSAFFLLVELVEREQDSASDVLAVTLEAFGDGEDPEDEEFEVGRAVPGGVVLLSVGFVGLSLVLIGLPPFSGFLAKFAILTSILGPGTGELGGSSAMRLTMATMLIVSGLVALIALSRIGIRTFWAPVEPLSAKITVLETVPVGLLLGLLLALAVQAGPVMEVMTQTASDLHAPQLYLDAVLGAERVPPYAERGQ